MKKQCELEEESVHEQIAAAKSFRATRGLAGLRNLARNPEARQDDEMRDLKHKVELERLRHRHEIEVQKLKSDAQHSEMKADYERQLRIMAQGQADKHHGAMMSQASEWRSLVQDQEATRRQTEGGPQPDP